MMKFDTSVVGQKIRRVRLQKNLTQKDICASEITRNNLSLIESGKSLPSLPTLCLIAERLDVPVGYFLTVDAAEDAKFANFFALTDIKAAYSEGNYTKCIELCEVIPESARKDELLFFLAVSHFRAALSCADSFDFSSASAHLNSAENSYLGTVYLSEEFLTAIGYYNLLFRSLKEQTIPHELYDPRNVSEYVSKEIIFYFGMLAGDEYFIGKDLLTNEFHNLHSLAIELMENGDMKGAYDILSHLADSGKLPFYMVFRVLDDLERAASEIGMFKVAYTAAKKKMKLLN